MQRSPTPQGTVDHERHYTQAVEMSEIAAHKSATKVRYQACMPGRRSRPGILLIRCRVGLSELRYRDSRRYGSVHDRLAKERMTRLAIIGTGYVGLTTGVCFAHLGHDVVCGDIDAGKVARLSRGEVPIVEHRLDELLAEGLRNGNLRFVVGAAAAVADAEIVFLCVPTPQGDDGSADLSYVEAAAREIAQVLPYECIVVNKSTVPVGSTRVVERVLQRPDVRVVSNPEFLREGSAVDDFLRPDRVVVGCEDRSAAIAVGALYDSIRAQVIVTDPASAETIKYAANAFLATKLSFVNAIAAVGEP